jgi:hypothetical protein
MNPIDSGNEQYRAKYGKVAELSPRQDPDGNISGVDSNHSH